MNIRFYLAVFLSGITVLQASARAPLDRPNMIVIMADDLGYNDLGFQGYDHIISPNLDRLAAEGTVFADGHVPASVCSPSRAGFMTGRYQQRFGHEANVPSGTQGMDATEVTIGEALQAAGYKTALYGKWHLGSTDAQSPNQRGFDHFWGMRGGGHNYWYQGRPGRTSNRKSPIYHNDKKEGFEGFLSDRLADRTMEFIDLNTTGEITHPFFIFLSFNAPHAPLNPKPEDLEKCNNDPYAALIYNMDMNIGRVMAHLDKRGLRENTLVWFLSDNGGVVEEASNKPLKGLKGTKFEGGHRVPFIMNWPGVVPAGQTYDGLTSALDIFATAHQLAGAPNVLKRPLDGVNLMPHVTKKNKAEPHQTLFWRRLGVACVREGDWKLIRVEGKGIGLYNVKDDLSENNDLAEAMPEKAEQLLAMLSEWEKPMIKPLWGEEERWTSWTADVHALMFDNKPYPRSASKRNRTPADDPEE